MISPSFVHLRLHTEYSLVDGLVRIKPLMKALPKLGMNAVAVTDHCNLFAAVKVFEAALSAGIKPILGCDIAYHDEEKPGKTYSLILLCQNQQGYRHLTELVSRAYVEGQYQGQPRLLRHWFTTEHTAGLIALSGGRQGDIGQALLQGDEERAERLATAWMACFPSRFFLEIQRTDRKDEATYNEGVVRLAEKLKLPLVATNEVCFITPDDYEAHEARVCIHQSVTVAAPNRPKAYSPKQYLRSAEEMQALFHDLPEALKNTVEIAKRCTVKLNLGQPCLPNFPTPAGTSVETYLSQLSTQGLEARFLQIFARLSPEDIAIRRVPYEERLQLELNVICSMGFSGYFLIVADFIRWARENSVPVGPGRGSGAGSLVAYALSITDLDPLQYDLLFERFLNPERVSMPDFDIDFCMEGRDRVIEYVAEKYGRESVSQIITFGTMAAKAVVRDVGRVLGHPYGFVDELAKLIPFELGMTLTTALSQQEELRNRYETEEDVKSLFDLALKLEGVTRNAGKHAGGVVIAPSKLTDYTAIYCEEGSSQIVSQFDKDDVESVGLVKFDFLGLRTLTIIKWAVNTINQKRQAENLELINIDRIPTDDTATFDLLKSCQTTAVFQLESRGMKEIIHRLQPDCFEEIIALVALFRPGPLQSGMVDDFIDRKHGLAIAAYLHPDLESILKPTYGVILYQEQVMQIAQVLANYTLGAADLLRRAMGKKKPEEMAKQRAIFQEGAENRGVDGALASSIFDLMEKFAGYGFNKSHSAAYALVAYQTGWLKAHYPAAFMAAVLSSDMDNTDKVVIFLDECAHMGLTVVPPSINSSHYVFTVRDEKTIVYGLGAIKGVGEAAVECLISSRNQSGPYEGIFEICQRVDLRKVNRRLLEILVKSGAMDEWSVERAVLFSSIEKALQGGLRFHTNQNSGQTDLLSLFEEVTCREDYVSCEPWSEKTRLEGEKETLGYYLTGHPSEVYLQEWASLMQPIEKLSQASGKQVMTCGLVTSIRQILTKRGKRLAIIGLEGVKSKLDIVVFSEVFEPHKTRVMVGHLLVVAGEVSVDDYSGGLKMMATGLYRAEDIREQYVKCLIININAEDADKLPHLQAIFKAHRGPCAVKIDYSNTQAKAQLMLSQEWAIKPHEELISILSHLFSKDKLQFEY